MIHLTRIKQEFQAKWIEVRVILACQLLCPMGSYAHGTAAAIHHHSQGPDSSFPSSPSAAQISRNGSKLQNGEKRAQGKPDDFYTPDNSLLFALSSQMPWHCIRVFQQKGCHGELIGISFHCCSHLSYVSLYASSLVLFRLMRQCKFPLHIFKSRTRGVFSSPVLNLKMSHYKYIRQINFLHFFSLGLISCLSTEISQASIEVLQGGGDPKSS